MRQPNILFIMTDDHASHAMGCYGSKVNETPNMDRIAEKGMRFTNCFCTNSICAPSRATILTGTHTHVNGVRTLGDKLDNRIPAFPGLLKEHGYQTAVIGKWHLGQEPEYRPKGYDHYSILPGQGEYFDPEMMVDGETRTFKGYVTDIITDQCLEWLDRIDRDRPFLLLCHHKAPHRPWLAHERYRNNHTGDIPLPETFHDDYSNRSEAASRATMRVERDFNAMDLKIKPPEGYGAYDSLPLPDDARNISYETLEGEVVTFQSREEIKEWKYLRYMQEYLRCIDCVDDGIGRILDYLEEKGLEEDTMVVYTSDQGFYLGDHGWYDKRFMYEQSLRMPLLVKHPATVKKPGVSNQMVLNLDFAQTFLDAAGIPAPGHMQGKSFLPLLESTWEGVFREDMYYRYWMHLTHHEVAAHYGIRTLRHKLIFYYGKALGTMDSIDRDTPEEWELFDLEKDPQELCNVYDDPAYQEIREHLMKRLMKAKEEAGDGE
ncbi:MAG: sulfatase [Clostridia bacterium]